MALTLAQIVTARRDRLLSGFVQDNLPPVVEVDGPEGLGRLLHLEEFLPGASLAPLGRRRTQNVVMIPGPPGDPHRASLWVRSGYASYQAAYLAFLKANYGLTLAPRDLSAAHDVDHLLNSARAGHAGVLLRIEALPRATNRQWGGYLEKLAASGLIAGNRRSIRLMSYLIAAKVAGLPPPSGVNDAAGIEALTTGLAALGLPASEVRQGLESMLTHIARNQP